ncbi:hypothetical protein L3X39_11760 [Sabulilitoribacter multivorans]|uniref:SpoIIAA-like n=1 Tax=Flaviramulus multivorans TaxID=1304750 RepID=A0ABS9IL19_9FLAO|nr:hypothetical protein [Flaviramulus multivorans]MCF7561313.1 hypothetical protein [Flaviramulus multivorans]
MKSYKLSFATVLILKNNLAEVIVDDGIEMNTTHAKEYLNFLSNNLEAPYSLIINRKHSYTYTFEAQKLIVNNPKVRNLAVVVASSSGLMASKSILNLNKDNGWNTKFFRTREDAVSWMNKKGHNHSQTI